MLEPLEVTFRLVTPAYAGAANKAETDGLRPPTLKALLRFWWRTMHPELGGEELFAKEAELFGSTGTGQGLRIIPRGLWPEPSVDDAGKLEKNQLHVYMAYGAVSWDKCSTADPARVRQGKKGASVIKVERMHPGQTVSLGLVARNANDLVELKKALWLLSAFGGFGSRNRRGWGALAVKCDLDGLPDPHDDASEAAASIAEGLQSIFGCKSSISVTGDGTPKYNAFSRDARVFVGVVEKKANKAHQKAFEVYRYYRRWLGKDRHAAGTGVDYQTRKGWLASAPTSGTALPFGSRDALPHNAQFSPPGTGPQVNIGVGKKLDGRRASSVFIKVIGSEGKFAPVILWLPCEFLPSDMDPYAQVNGGTPVKLSWPEDDGHEGVLTLLDGSAAGSGPLSKHTPALPGLVSRGWTEVTW